MQDIFGNDVDVAGDLNDPGDMLQPTWDSRVLLQAMQPVHDLEEPVTNTTAAASSRADEVQDRTTAFMKIAKVGKTGLPWPQVLLAERKTALSRWRLIIEIAPETSRLGRQLLAASEAKDAEARAALILADTFGAKATATLEARAGALLAFIRWSRACDSETVMFPMEESRCYEYICWLRESKAAPTRAKSFREAIAFVHGVVGMDTTNCLDSRRMQGAAIALVVTKALDRDMDPLAHEQVLLLEQASIHLPGGPDKVFAGFVTFLVNAIARMSDTFYCVGEPVLDVAANGHGFIQVEVSKTKTSSTSGRRTKSLPLVGITPALTGECWAQSFLQERQAQGIALLGEGPLMPAVSHDGSWRDVRLSSGDACVWLRELLRSLGGTISSSMRLGSHSCKKTLLAWLAKYGVAIGVRRMLGHHVKPKEASALVYSRDALAGPLRELQKLLAAVRDRRFFPDSTRSGRFSAELGGSSEAVSAAVTVGWEADEVGGEADAAADDLKVFGQHDYDAEDEPSDVVHEQQQVRAQENDEPGPASSSGVTPEASLPDLWTGADFVHEETARCRTTDLLHEGDEMVRCECCSIEGCNACADLAKDHLPGWICDFCLKARDQDEYESYELASSVSSSSAEAEEGEEGNEACYELASEAVASQASVPSETPPSCMHLGSYQPLAQHKVYRTLHYVRDMCSTSQRNDEGVLVCGRRFTHESHQLLATLPCFAWPTCSDCFGSSSALTNVR
jgi:hypothetical protein